MEGKPLEVEIYARAERFTANFRLPYAPGELKAVAIEGGKPLAESVLRTVGDPVRVRLMTR